MVRARPRVRQFQAPRALLWAAAGALLLLPLASRGQDATAVAPGANRIAGLVTDTLGIPLADVDVYVTQLQRHTRSKPNGTFVFDDIRPGRYEVGARILGYVAGTSRVTVGADGGTVHIEMVRYAVALPSMITVVERTGLSGIIGDTAYRAMREVNVRILGTDKHVVSDSIGTFYVDVKPGQYMVELTRPGYERQLIGVTIPSSGGRRVAAWMRPQEEKPNPLLAANVFEMTQRTMRADPIYSHYFTREDMKAHGITEVRELASRQTMKPIEADCRALVDGGPQTMPLWQLTEADVEFVEVHVPKPRAPRVTSIRPDGSNGSGPVASTSMIPPSAGCSATVIVWLRR